MPCVPGTLGEYAKARKGWKAGVRRQSKQPPLEYVWIHVVYDIKGKGEDRDAVLAAVKESQEKICGVSHMLKRVMPVTWEVNFNGEMIFSNKEIFQPR